MATLMNGMRTNVVKKIDYKAETAKLVTELFARGIRPNVMIDGDAVRVSYKGQHVSFRTWFLVYMHLKTI